MFKQARNALAAVIGGATGGTPATLFDAARVYLGWKSFVNATASLAKNVQDVGPMAMVGLVQQATGESIEGGGSFVVPVRVYLYFSKGDDNEFEDVDDLMESIFSRARDQATNFDPSSAIQPSQMSIDSVEYDFMSHDGLLCMQLSFTFPDP